MPIMEILVLPLNKNTICQMTRNHINSDMHEIVQAPHQACVINTWELKLSTIINMCGVYGEREWFAQSSEEEN
jgi:hypothetical protein